jgi:hypothetical protein
LDFNSARLIREEAMMNKNGLLLAVCMGFLTIAPTFSAEGSYLKNLEIKVPNMNSVITTVVPKNITENDFSAPINESLAHARSMNGATERIMKEAIAYSLAGAFETALENKNSAEAVGYAVSAIINGAHKIDDSFLYTLEDTNPQLIDRVIQVLQEDKLDQQRKAWNTTKETVDALISFQTPNSNRFIPIY